MLTIHFNKKASKYAVGEYRDEKSHFTIKTDRSNINLILELLNPEEKENN